MDHDNCVVTFSHHFSKPLALSTFSIKLSFQVKNNISSCQRVLVEYLTWKYLFLPWNTLNTLFWMFDLKNIQVIWAVT